MFETNRTTLDDIKNTLALACMIEEHLNGLWLTKPYADLQYNRVRLVYAVRLTGDAIATLNLYIKQFPLAKVSIYKSQVEIDIYLSLDD